jgi:hypothetical protein
MVNDIAVTIATYLCHGWFKSIIIKIARAIKTKISINKNLYIFGEFDFISKKAFENKIKNDIIIGIDGKK